MALVSPGIQISINDQSQYVNANVGSVPLVVLATEQDKTYNGAPASGTSKANAGKLLSFSSQRDLVTTMGTPSFQLSAAGSPVNGSEINEYGLLTAYSALGISNQLFAIRADVDLNELRGTAVRPSSPPPNNAYWLDTANTEFGVYALNATTGEFANVDPLLISDKTLLADDSDFAYSVPTPISAYGTTGSYALVLVDTDGEPINNIRLFYKAGATSVSLNNTWVQVGSVKWQKSHPVVIGTTENATIAASSTLVINTQTVTTGVTTVEHYKRRFYGLMESSIGNVKPLLSEDYKPCPNEKYTVTGTKVLKTKEELKQHLIKTKPANPITIERYCNGKPVDSRYAELNSKNEVVISDETIYE
jgi:hypothetical protein